MRNTKNCLLDIISCIVGLNYIKSIYQLESFIFHITVGLGFNMLYFITTCFMCVTETLNIVGTRQVFFRKKNLNVNVKQFFLLA